MAAWRMVVSVMVERVQFMVGRSNKEFMLIGEYENFVLWWREDWLELRSGTSLTRKQEAIDEIKQESGSLNSQKLRLRPGSV